jgi:hypothetical protein
MHLLSAYPLGDGTRRVWRFRLSELSAAMLLLASRPLVYEEAETRYGKPTLRGTCSEGKVVYQSHLLSWCPAYAISWSLCCNHRDIHVDAVTSLRNLRQGHRQFPMNPDLTE